MIKIRSLRKKSRRSNRVFNTQKEFKPLFYQIKNCWIFLFLIIIFYTNSIILRTENALGSFYTDKFEREKNQSDFDSAVMYFNSAIETTKALKAFGSTGALYNNLGQLFYHSKDYTSSIFYYEQAKSVFKSDSNNIVACFFPLPF